MLISSSTGKSADSCRFIVFGFGLHLQNFEGKANAFSQIYLSSTKMQMTLQFLCRVYTVSKWEE